MTHSDPARPSEIGLFPSGEIGIVWPDGHESYFEGRRLRCACPCANCVDEMTGEKVLEDSGVPSDVRALELLPVGNYGVAVRWSDGHETGIYTFRHLREACPCDACSSP